MGQNAERKVKGQLSVSSYLAGELKGEPQWADIEPFFRNGTVRKRGFVQAEFYIPGQEPGSRSVQACVEVRWIDEQYIMFYTDFTDQYDDSFTSSNPDPSAVGKYEFYGHDWDASCLRKDIEFVEYFFKQFVELGWIDVDEFTDPDWTPKKNHPAP